MFGTCSVPPNKRAAEGPYTSPGTGKGLPFKAIYVFQVGKLKTCGSPRPLSDPENPGFGVSAQSVSCNDRFPPFYLLRHS